MIAYLVLIVVLAILLVAALHISRYELLAPVPLFLLGMMVAVGLALLGMTSWNEMEPGAEVVAVVVTGCVSVLIGCLIVERAMGVPSGKHFADVGVKRMEPHPTSAWKYAVVIGIILAAIVLRIYETVNIADAQGILGDNFFETSKNVRSVLASFNSSDGVQMGVGFSMVERQLEKVVNACGYVLAFLLARQVTQRTGIKSLALPLFALLAAVTYHLLTGGRGTILFLAISFISGVVLQRLIGGADAKRLSLRVFGVCVACAVVGAMGFYASGFLIGRSPSSGMIEYISFYFGCGVPSLESFFEQGLSVSHPDGALTFYNLFAFLYKMGFVDSLPSYSIAWVNLGGHSSNIFTCFARYYLDFGIPGVVLLSLLVGAFMTAVYRWARRGTWLFAAVFAGYLAPYAFDMAREEFVFSRLFSMTGFLTIAIMLLVTIFLMTSLREDWQMVRGWLRVRHMRP